MDPNAVVLEISSDEDVDWNDYGRGTSDAGDDHNWLAELLDEVNKENCGDDSDEVVVVSESEKPLKKSKLRSCVVDLDDDCVVLEYDPDEPVKVRNENPSNGGDDSDDIVVVSEKGQVACRDYPHPRHLCIKFPFSTTPNESHCNQCYCYVCDSLAPCVYWGNGSATTDHCHATDKDEFWTLKRENAKNVSKGIQPVSQLPPVESQRPAPVVQPQNQIPRHGMIHAHHPSANIQPPNIINQNRNHILASRNKLHPDFVSPVLPRHHQNSNFGTRVHSQVFKRTGTVGVATTANRNPNGSYRGSFGNPSRQQNYHVNGMLSGSNGKYLGSLQPNAVNTSVPYPPQSQNFTSSTVNYHEPLPPHSQNQYFTSSTVNHNQPLPPQPHFFNHSNPNFQSRVNSNMIPELPLYQQSHLVAPVSSRSQLMPVQPSYIVPAQPTHPVPSQTRVDSLLVPLSDHTQKFPQENQTQGAIMDSGFKENGVSCPSGQDSATVEGARPMSEPSLAGIPSVLADIRYDWYFDSPPDEPGFMDIPGPDGLIDCSSDSAFIDTGPIFNL